MFAAVMMPPIFGGSSSDVLPSLPPVSSFSPVSALPSSPYRPVKSSPLSSSPVRASSPPASSWLLSQQDTQSSPVQLSSSTTSGAASSPWLSTPTSLQTQGAEPFSSFNNTVRGTHKTPFRFASRPTKPVPRLQQSRDAMRQTRRSLFLRNVRQRADDHNWDRRNCEQELQKLEWWSLEREIRQAKETDAMSMLTEHDIEDAADWVQLPSSLPSFSMRDADHDEEDDHATYYYNQEYDHAADERMADLLAMEEDAEIEALIASMDADEPRLPFNPSSCTQPDDEDSTRSRPDSVLFSDDGDYDAIFAELLAEQQEGIQDQPPPSFQPHGGEEDMAMGSS